MATELKQQLRELGFQPNEIKIYLGLTQLGEAKASTIAKKAGLPRTTAISILQKLEAENYLTTHRYKGVTFYWIESPQTLVSVFENRMHVAQELNTLLSGLYRTEAHFPHAKVYDTKLAIRNYFETILAKLPKGETIYTIDTPSAGNYRKIYSDKVTSTFYQMKKTKQILTKSLVPFGSFANIDQHKLKLQNIEIREMPQDIKFTASILLIGQQLTHFSGNPPFAVAIEHPLVVASTKSIFDFLWNISTPK